MISGEIKCLHVVTPTFRISNNRNITQRVTAIASKTRATSLHSKLQNETQSSILRILHHRKRYRTLQHPKGKTSHPESLTKGLRSDQCRVNSSPTLYHLTKKQCRMCIKECSKRRKRRESQTRRGYRGKSYLSSSQRVVKSMCSKRALPFCDGNYLNVH